MFTQTFTIRLQSWTSFLQPVIDVTSFPLEASGHLKFEILYDSVNHVFWDLSCFTCYCCLKLFDCLGDVCIHPSLQVSPEKKVRWGQVRGVGQNKIWPGKTALNQRQIKIFIWKPVCILLNSVKLSWQSFS